MTKEINILSIEMKTIKHVGTSNYCETCTRLEEIKDKVREDGKTRHCSCTCGSAQVWVVKEKDEGTEAGV